MDLTEISEDTISVDEVLKKVTSPCCGAVSLFVGTTRDNFEGKKVVRLEYEAYVPMAKLELKKLCSTTRDVWPDIKNMAIYHRIGLVPVTEASVVIAVASPHRQSSLEAVHFVIDTLKAVVPIWKKEVYDEGDPEWKENKECPWRSAVKKCDELKTDVGQKTESSK